MSLTLTLTLTLTLIPNPNQCIAEVSANAKPCTWRARQVVAGLAPLGRDHDQVDTEAI